MPPNGRATGTLKSFDAKTGYGFVSCEELLEIFGRDVFIHKSVYIGGAEVGSDIEFDWKLNDHGQPQVIALIDGPPVQAYVFSNSELERIFF